MSKIEINKYRHIESGNIVEAVLWETAAEGPEIAKWCNGNIRKEGRFKDELMTIMTLGDVRCAEIDMYIFKDKYGGFYPSEYDVFTELYEPVEVKDGE